MKEIGVVKSVEGGICLVAVNRKTACGENCATCKGACSAEEQIFSAKNAVGAIVGDKVSIEIDTKRVLKSAFLVYILPLLVFLAAYLTGAEIFENNIVTALGSVVSAGIVFLCLCIYDKKYKEKYLPTITEII